MDPSPDETGRLKAFTGRSQRRRFGRYETLFRIAGGGMAEVYAARIVGEGGFEKVVALKRMLPTLAEDERFVSMFLDEGRVAAHISSPHVVQTLDLGRADDDSLYLVMELVVGVPLGQLIRGVLKSGEYVDLDIAVEIIAQAATGLHDAHEATTPMGDPLRLIHRDISPQNILVDRSGRTRITDFGVARAMQSHSQTQTGELKGKMAYFAPEQAKGGLLTSRVDIFALGIVAWELITARRLFKSDNPLNTLRKVIDEPIASVLDYRPDIPKALADCIDKALQREPDDRFDTARDFAQALRASITPARQSAVGAYVKLHGSAALAPLEEGLRRALSGDPEDEEETRVASPRSTDSGSVSTSKIIPSGSLGGSQSGSLSLTLTAADSAGTQPTTASPNRMGLVWASLAVGVIGIAAAVFFSLRAPEPSSTALAPLPTTATPAPEEEGTGGAAPVMVAEEEETLQDEPEVEEVETAAATNPRGMRGRVRGMQTRMSPQTPVETAMEVETVMASPMTTAMTSPMTTAMATAMTAMEEPATTGEATMNEETGMTGSMNPSDMLLMQWGDP